MTSHETAVERAARVRSSRRPSQFHRRRALAQRHDRGGQLAHQIARRVPRNAAVRAAQPLGAPHAARRAAAARHPARHGRAHSRGRPAAAGSQQRPAQHQPARLVPAEVAAAAARRLLSEASGSRPALQREPRAGRLHADRLPRRRPLRRRRLAAAARGEDARRLGVPGHEPGAAREARAASRRSST